VLPAAVADWRARRSWSRSSGLAPNTGSPRPCCCPIRVACEPGVVPAPMCCPRGLRWRPRTASLEAGLCPARDERGVRRARLQPHGSSWRPPGRGGDPPQAPGHNPLVLVRPGCVPPRHRHLGRCPLGPSCRLAVCGMVPVADHAPQREFLTYPPVGSTARRCRRGALRRGRRIRALGGRVDHRLRERPGGRVGPDGRPGRPQGDPGSPQPPVRR
jgi:hypothetical protein